MLAWPSLFEAQCLRASDNHARARLRKPALDHPDLDPSNGLDWFQIFGLDRKDPQGGPPDGLIDKEDPFLFDLQRGLLKFPMSMPRPFAADSTLYTRNADSDTFDWSVSRLKDEHDLLDARVRRSRSFGADAAKKRQPAGGHP